MTLIELPEVDLLGLPSTPRPQGVLADVNGSNENSVVHGVVQELDDALRRFGGCYLRNHGIRSSSMTSIFAKSKEFFKLPSTTKDLYAKGEDKMSSFGGYYVSQNQRFRERYDIMNAGIENKFPEEEVAGFTAAVENYREDCNALTHFLLTSIAKACGKQNNYFVDQHRGTFSCDPKIETRSHLTTLFYHNVDVDQCVGDDKLMMAKHTDFTSLTILASSAKGLQVQLPGKTEWFNADPREGCVLLNVGDLMERWTGGDYPATVHRVLKMSHEDAEGRQSIPYFVHPDVSTIVAPLFGKRYAPVRAGEYFDQKMSKKPAASKQMWGDQTPPTA